MINIVDLFPGIIGIVGTLLGTVLGWLLSRLSQKGKLIIYPVWEDRFNHNEKGAVIPSPNKEKAEEYDYRLSLDIYNSSGDPQIMRKIEVVFFHGKDELFRDIPEDDSTCTNNGYLLSYDAVSSITIPAKNVYTLKLHNGFWDTDDRFSKIWKTDKIMLIYRNNKDKEKRVLIKRDDYKQYFEKQPISVDKH